MTQMSSEMDENILKVDTVFNVILKGNKFNKGKDACVYDTIPKSKRPKVDAEFMKKIDEAYPTTSQKAVFDLPEAPRSILCTDKSIEDVCVFKTIPKIDAESHSTTPQKAFYDLHEEPRSVLCSDTDISIEDVPKQKRPKIGAEYMKIIEEAHPTTSQKASYENLIIDKKRQQVLVSETEDFCQTCNCTIDSPCGRNSCLRFKTIEYNSDCKDDLHTDLLSKERKPFTYSFNLEMYSGIENIKKVKFVGKGGFGEVFKCNDSKTKCLLVMKRSKKEIEANEVVIPILFPNEQNIARILGCFFDGQGFYIIQEYAGTSLNSLMTKNMCKFLKKPREILTFSLQLFTGINTLAQHNITHSDLKPHNVCLNINVDGSFLLKLIDFGSCQTNKDPLRLTGLTPEYLPPDFNKSYSETRRQCAQNKDFTQNLHLKKSLNSGVDIWAAGLILLFIYKKKHPMVEYFKEELSKYKDKFKRKKENMKLIGQLSDPLDEYFTTDNESIDYLLSKILVVDAVQRWKASQILKHIEAELKKAERCKTVQELMLSKKYADCMDVDIKKEKSECSKKIVLHDKKFQASQKEMKPQKSLGLAIQESSEQKEQMEYNLQMEHNNIYKASHFQGHHPGMGQAQPFLFKMTREQPSPLANVSITHPLPSLSLREDRIPRFDILLGEDNQ